MSKTTAVNAIPYPEDNEAPDGPTQIKAVAELLDTLKWGSRNLKPTFGVKSQSTESIALEASYTDLTGAKLEITPAVASTLLVVAVFDFTGEGPASGTLKVDSESEQTKIARFVGSGSDRATVSQVYAISLTAAAHTIQMRAKRGAAAATSTFYTQMLYALFAS